MLQTFNEYLNDLQPTSVAACVSSVVIIVDKVCLIHYALVSTGRIAEASNAYDCIGKYSVVRARRRCNFVRSANLSKLWSMYAVISFSIQIWNGDADVYSCLSDAIG